RVLNPVVQGKRLDPDGAYVRRWVPELASLSGSAVHEPWKLRGEERDRLEYPEPVVDLSEGLTRFRQARGLE
ncbi:FAD-binding domain-containing protein, partial [Streptomyces sp. SID9124]|uniref:FAD-binding domain-containing protein n=1 Tax=Streptomyces sp. SID9124 TaxID=2706108 RepID=UPI0014006FF1